MRRHRVGAAWHTPGRPVRSLGWRWHERAAICRLRFPQRDYSWFSNSLSGRTMVLYCSLSHPSRQATVQPRGFLRSDSPATGLSQGDLLTRYLPCLLAPGLAPLASPQWTQWGCLLVPLSPGVTRPCRPEKEIGGQVSEIEGEGETKSQREAQVRDWVAMSTDTLAHATAWRLRGGQPEQMTSVKLFWFPDLTGQPSQHNWVPVWVQGEGLKFRCTSALLGAQVGVIPGSQDTAWRRVLHGASSPTSGRQLGAMITTKRRVLWMSHLEPAHPS